VSHAYIYFSIKIIKVFVWLDDDLT
jgi:hypothetical protein